MEVKVKKCELNFKNTREKIVMEVTFQKTNEAVDIRDFLCKAMSEIPCLHVEFSKGEYKVTTTASTNACAILEQLPKILQTFRNFSGQANEGHVPDTNSKPNDMEIQKNKGKGNIEDQGHGSNDMEIQRNKEKGNIEDKNHGSETHEERKKLTEFLGKENFANRHPDSPNDSEIRKETKKTKTEIEAINRASASNCACTPHCREAGEGYSKAETLKQKDSRGFKAQQREEFERESMAYQESDNSQTTIRSSYGSQPTAEEGMAGVQNEEITPSLDSLGAKIKTNKSNSNKAGDVSEQGPNSSRFEGPQGKGKAENPREHLETGVSETISKQDKSKLTSKPVDSQEHEGSVPKQAGENLGITKAQTTSGEEASGSDKEAEKCTGDPEPAVPCTGAGGPKLSHSEAHQMKGNTEKSGDNEATDRPVSAIESHGHAGTSILGNAQAQNGTTMMKNIETTSSLTDAKNVKKTNTDSDTRTEEKLNLQENQST